MECHRGPQTRLSLWEPAHSSVLVLPKLLFVRTAAFECVGKTLLTLPPLVKYQCGVTGVASDTLHVPCPLDQSSSGLCLEVKVARLGGERCKSGGSCVPVQLHVLSSGPQRAVLCVAPLKLMKSVSSAPVLTLTLEAQIHARGCAGAGPPAALSLPNEPT